MRKDHFSITTTTLLVMLILLTSCQKTAKDLLEDEEKRLVKQLEKDPVNKDLMFSLGLVNYRQGDMEDTKEIMSKSLDLDPDNDTSLALLGNVYRRQGNLVAAKAMYDRAQNLNSSNPRLYSGLGFYHYSQGNLSGAEENFHKSLELSNSNDTRSIVYSGLGTLHLARGETQKAIAMFNASNLLYPSFKLPYVKLAQIRMEQGRFLEAEHYLKESIELGLEDEEAYAALAWLYINQSELSLAEKTLDNLHKTLPPSAVQSQIHNALAIIHIREERFQDAERILKKAQEINRTYPHTYRNLEWLYLETNQTEELILLAQDAQKIPELEQSSYKSFAVAYWRQGNYHETKSMFLRALEIDSEDDNAYALLGRLALEQERLEEGISMLEKALAINPNNSIALGEVSYLEEHWDLRPVSAPEGANT